MGEILLVSSEERGSYTEPYEKICQLRIVKKKLCEKIQNSLTLLSHNSLVNWLKSKKVKENLEKVMWVEWHCENKPVALPYCFIRIKMER